MKLLPLPTPGSILNEEFLEPMKLSQYALAKAIGVPPRRINEIVKGQRAISVDTALRFSKYFGTSPELWLNLQNLHDLMLKKRELAATLERIEVRDK
jgi:addiction module HigA family antidote